MMIKLSEAQKKYDMKITGVIHAGAHFAEEHEDYLACGIEKVIYFEPCQKAFEHLLKKFKGNKNVKLYKCALGDKKQVIDMYVETANQGQSNSLLKPVKHLDQFPDIKFTDTEKVGVLRLNDVEYDRPRYNFLNMDVQGYENRVLKGADRCLKHFDYVYTEVNIDEVYEDCARMTELDYLLSDFERVETNMGGGTWGDALYIRKKAAENGVAFN